MTKGMSVEEFKEISGKLRSRTIERIFSTDIRIKRYSEGKFSVVVGCLVLCEVDLMSGSIKVMNDTKGITGFNILGSVNLETLLQSYDDSALIDDLREAVGEKPEEEEELEDLMVPEVDEEVNEEGIMQLAELFEEEEDGQN